MNNTIELTAALYERLEKHASGFNQTPVCVIEKILDCYEDTMANQAVEYNETINPTSYIYNGQTLDKSRLVLRVITDFVNQQEEDINLYQLGQAFPNDLQGPIGIVNKFFDVAVNYDGKVNKCHFLDEYDLLDLQDGKVAVSTEWGAANTAKFIEQARRLGFKIKVDRDCAPLKLVSNDSSDQQKYMFNGEEVDAGHLVLKVISDYVHKQEDDINLYQLGQAFPNDMQGSIGTVNKFYDVVTKYDGHTEKHHFLDEDQLLDLQDGKVAVSSSWDHDNIEAFIQAAHDLGYDIGSHGSHEAVEASHDKAVMHGAAEDEASQVSEAEDSTQVEESVDAKDASKTSRLTKYTFNKEKLSGGHLVLKVITDYAYSQEEDINLYQLTQAFPNELQGPIGIANKYEDVFEKYDGQVNKRHFVKDKYLLDLQDGKVAVASEWDEHNIHAFIERAREHGYNIDVDGESAPAKAKASTSDTDAYIFNDETLDADHLVLKVITDYVSIQEEDINLYQLAQAFPNNLQGESDVAKKLDDILQITDEAGDKLYFIDESELLDLQDGKVAISAQWDESNIGGFIKQAMSLGYHIDGPGIEQSSVAA